MNYELGIGYQEMSCSAFGILRTLHAVDSLMVQPTGVEVEFINLEVFISLMNCSQFFILLIGESLLCKYLFLIVSSSAVALQRVGCVP